MNSLNNIVLIGFMASGKSSVGRKLAEKLGYKFIDTDSIIEQFEGKSISKIFDENGEDYFRVQEQACIHWMRQNLHKCVIATGGGMPIYSSGLDKVGKVFYLSLDFEIIQERLTTKESQKRPLVNELKSLEKLYHSRLEKYKMSAQTIINANQPIEKIVEKIMKEID